MLRRKQRTNDRPFCIAQPNSFVQGSISPQDVSLNLLRKRAPLLRICYQLIPLLGFTLILKEGMPCISMKRDAGRRSSQRINEPGSSREGSRRRGGSCSFETMLLLSH
jgi:hypothetical protein